jgi:hypothetical protein
LAVVNKKEKKMPKCCYYNYQNNKKSSISNASSVFEEKNELITPHSKYNLLSSFKLCPHLFELSLTSKCLVRSTIKSQQQSSHSSSDNCSYINNFLKYNLEQNCVDYEEDDDDKWNETSKN